MDDVKIIDGAVDVINGRKYVNSVLIEELDGYDCKPYDMCYGYISGHDVNLNFIASDYTVPYLINSFGSCKIKPVILTKLVDYASDVYNAHIGIPKWFKGSRDVFYNFIFHAKDEHWKRLMTINGFPDDACDISGLSPKKLLSVMEESPLYLYSIFPELALRKDRLTVEGGSCTTQDDLLALSKLSNGTEYGKSLPVEILSMYGWCVIENKTYQCSVAVKSGEIRNFFATLKAINLNVNEEGLNEQQKSAVNSRSTRLFITGGPGTGKSFIINRYVDCLIESSIPYLVVASSAVAVDNLDNRSGFQGSTIHMARYHSYAMSKAQVIIVEEVSMVDLTCLWWIAMRAKSCKKIIFVGDKDQIPPPGGMSVISSLLSGCTTIQLTECMRRIEPIVRFELMTFASLFDNPDIAIIPYDFSLLVPLLADYYMSNVDNLIMATSNKVIDGLNININKHIHGQGMYIHIGSKVSCRKNNYTYKILNGQDFIVESVEHTNYVIRATAESRNNKAIKIPIDVFASHFTLGYCRTMHRSQGKESDSVVIIIPNVDKLLTKNVLYTALTRTRGRVIIVTNVDPSYSLPVDVLPECPIFLIR
jgi:hypothetical protein